MDELITSMVEIGNPIGNLYRGRHVLVLVVDTNGDFILGKKKDFYPTHIARLLGGGIKDDEDPALAAKREIGEELKVVLPIESFASLCSVITKASTSQGLMEMQTWIFAVHLPNAAKIEPGDDISCVKMYSPEQYSMLIEAMEGLTGEFNADEFSFRWSDWGKIYAPLHRYALEYYRKLNDNLGQA